MKSFVLLAAVLLLLPGLAFAESPMSVQAALDYQVPENTCSKPRIITGEAIVTNMALIQRVYMTPDGVLEEAELAENSASPENQ